MCVRARACVRVCDRIVRAIIVCISQQDRACTVSASLLLSRTTTHIYGLFCSIFWLCIKKVLHLRKLVACEYIWHVNLSAIAKIRRDFSSSFFGTKRTVMLNDLSRWKIRVFSLERVRGQLFFFFPIRAYFNLFHSTGQELRWILCNSAMSVQSLLSVPIITFLMHPLKWSRVINDPFGTVSGIPPMYRGPGVMELMK